METSGRCLYCNQTLTTGLKDVAEKLYSKSGIKAKAFCTREHYYKFQASSEIKGTSLFEEPDHKITVAFKGQD